MTEPPKKKLIGLEIIRFLSACVVIIYHYHYFFFVNGTAPDAAPATQPLAALLQPVYTYGFYGVQVFWCISGYIFCWKYAAAIRARTVGAARFFWYRFSRLYPLHFATLLLAAALQFTYRARNGFFFVYQWNDLRHFVLNIFFASAWGLQKGFSFNAPVWSVSIEVLVYGIFFVATLLTGASMGRSLLWMLVSLAAVRKELPGVLLWQCIFCFYTGAFAFYAGEFLDRKAPASRALHNVAIVATGAVVNWVAIRRVGEFSWLNVTIIAAAVIMLSVCNEQYLMNRVVTAIAKLGNLTYSSYLIHFPLQIAITLLFGRAAVPSRMAVSPLFLGLFLLITFALAYVIYEYFEVPAQRALRLYARRWE